MPCHAITRGYSFPDNNRRRALAVHVGLGRQQRKRVGGGLAPYLLDEECRHEAEPLLARAERAVLGWSSAAFCYAVLQDAPFLLLAVKPITMLSGGHGRRPVRCAYRR